MPESRECPLCGGTMRMRRTAIPPHLPGHPKPAAPATIEWICPDCDYFEEAEEEKA